MPEIEDNEALYEETCRRLIKSLPCFDKLSFRRYPGSSVISVVYTDGSAETIVYTSKTWDQVGSFLDAYKGGYTNGKKEGLRKGYSEGYLDGQRNM